MRTGLITYGSWEYLLSSFIVVGLSLLFGELFADKFGWIGGLLAGIFGSLLIILMGDPESSYFQY